MNNFYFENAKKWYTDIYISSIFLRIYYFILIVVLVSSAYFVYTSYKATFPLKTTLSMVAKLNHTQDKKVFFRKMNYKQTTIGIAEYIIYKAIIQKESFDSVNLASAISDKFQLMKSFFAEDILQEYEMENLEEDEENDLNYAVKGFRKKVQIDDIIFLNQENKDITKTLFYKLSLFEDTNKAVVYFTTCNDLLETCQKYQAFIQFEIKMPIIIKNTTNTQKDNVIDFKIISYNRQIRV